MEANEKIKELETKLEIIKAKYNNTVRTLIFWKDEISNGPLSSKTAITDTIQLCLDDIQNGIGAELYPASDRNKKAEEILRNAG